MASRKPAIITMCALAAAACGAFVFFNYIDRSKLCIQVIAEQWAKEKGLTPDMYIRQNAQFLHMQGATDREVNEAWKKWMSEADSKDHDAAQAAQRMEMLRNRADCN